VPLQEQLNILYGRAPEGKAVFDAFCRQLVCDIGLDPDLIVLRVQADDGKADDKIMRVHTAAPLKSRKRASEKARDDYENDGRQLVDIVRASIIVDNEDDLEAVVKRLNENYVANECDGVRIVRFKNRFREPMPDGGRDVNYNIVVTLKDGSRFVCELQVHVKQILNFKEAAHVSYGYFRTFYKGGGAMSQRAELLEKIARNRDVSDIPRFIKSALGGRDEEELEALANLLDGMSELNILQIIRRRLVELARLEANGENSMKFAVQQSHLAVVLRRQGRFDEAKPLCQRALAIAEETFGPVHPEVAARLNSLAGLLRDKVGLLDGRAFHHSSATG